MTNHYSLQVRRALRLSGWTEERCVDLAPVVSFLEVRGVAISDQASAFLSEFHGLIVSSEFTRDNRTLHNSVTFDVTESTTWHDDGQLEQLQAHLGVSLCPIGFKGREDLFMSRDGQIYTLALDWAAISRSERVDDLLETILTERWPAYSEVIWLDDDRHVIHRQTHQ